MNKRLFFVSLIACLLVLALPVLASAATINITTSAQLEDAIENQSAGDVWLIANGTYDTGRNWTHAKGNPVSEQTGWYFLLLWTT